VSAFQKAGLIPFCPTVMYDKLVEFLALIRRAESDSESDSDSEIDWSSCITPDRNIRSIRVYSTYIDKRLQANITEGLDLTPSVGRAIEKQ
jgi:hypothetical protein